MLKVEVNYELSRFYINNVFWLVSEHYADHSECQTVKKLERHLCDKIDVHIRGKGWLNFPDEIRKVIYVTKGVVCMTAVDHWRKKYGIPLISVL